MSGDEIHTSPVPAVDLEALIKAQAVTAEQIEAATRAVYDADNHDYTEASSFFHGMRKPYLENDYDRYESMARAALTAPGGKQ